LWGEYQLVLPLILSLVSLRNGAINTSLKSVTTIHDHCQASTQYRRSSNHATITTILTTDEVFSVWFVPRLYNEIPEYLPGSNTSTVALRGVGGDEKGSLESGTAKYCLETHGTRTREWLRWRESDSSFPQREHPHINKTETVLQ
jgi:hypothetical protein